MASQVVESASAAGFWLIDKDGNKTYSTANEIQTYATYNIKTLDSSGNIAANEKKPTDYEYVQLDFSNHNSVYSATHFVAEYKTDYKIYIKQYSGGQYYTDSLGYPVGFYPWYNTKINTKNPIETELGVTTSLISDPLQSLNGYSTITVTQDNRQLAGTCALHKWRYQNITWAGTVKIIWEGIGGANPPCHTVTWERCDPEAIYEEIVPGNGAFVDEKAETIISVPFNIKVSESGIEYPPTEIILNWGTSGTNMPNTIIGDATNQRIVIPANTFPDKASIWCQIKYRSAAANEYFTTSQILYNTTDLIGFVNDLAPNNMKINGDTDQELTWKYVNNSGLNQIAFDLQISNDNGIIWVDVFSHAESNECKAVIPANTFLSGNALWRVRAYNTDDVPSEWSDPAYLVVVAPPSPPIITSIKNTPLISISWSARDQQAYQITANDYDSGIVFGGAKTFTIPHYYFNEETVKISIRIKNHFGEWSERAFASVQIVNISPGTIAVRGNTENSGIALSWQAEGTFTKYYVLRDKMIIGQTEEAVYTDYFSTRQSKYQIMGVDDNSYYTLSDEIMLAPIVCNAIISKVDVIEWISLIVKRGNIPEFSSEQTENITYQFYSGRILPVPYSSRFQSITRTLDFTVKLPELQKLRNLVGKIIIYKDYTGEKIVGVLDDLQTSGRVIRPDVSMSITAIDYAEEIELD